MDTTPDLLAQLRRLVAMEQAARIAPPVDDAARAGFDGGVPPIPVADAAQVEAMLLRLLAGAQDGELLAASAAAPPGSAEARWLADEIARRGSPGGPGEA